MTPFDLLFILLSLLALSTLVLAITFVLRRQFARARRILWRLFLCACVYMLIVIAVSPFLPRRVFKLGETQCFDDWCAAVTAVRKVPEGDLVRYTVDLRLSSRALRVPQRERNLAFYLIDSHGRRYNPQFNPSDAPFDVLLQPQESAVASRSFLLPADASQVSAVIAHEGGFPIEWFIIGYDAWFHKPPLIEIPVVACVPRVDKGLLYRARTGEKPALHWR
jgi:hypothetical protein